MIKRSIFFRTLLLIPVVLFILSCSAPGPVLPGWLEGEWETGKSDGFTGETWTTENDTLMSGKGLTQTHGVVMVTEEIAIFISQDEMFYRARVPDQNEGKAILFKATYSDHDHLVFENPDHDFPTRIVYKLKSNNSLEINISGRDEKDSRTIELQKK